MLLEFSVENYLSFKDKTTFSMVGNATAGHEKNYIEFDNMKIMKSASIYGANASGKSNLIKAFTSFILLIRRSNSFNDKTLLITDQFIFDDKMISKPTNFEMKFILDGVRYIYGVTLNSKKIIDEYLFYYPNGREKKIFERLNTDEYSYGTEFASELKKIEKANSVNKLFLATAAALQQKDVKKVFNFFLNNIDTISNVENIRNLSYDYYESLKGKSKKDIIEFLKKFDLNIEDYKIEYVDIPLELTKNLNEGFGVLKKAKIFKFKHIGSDKWLDISFESLGTQILFIMFPFLNDAFNNSKILIIDELERGLHPLILKSIIEMFNSEKNKKISQLIFTTHNTTILDSEFLRRDQIWFAEKKYDTGESELFALSDFSVRKNENFEKCYLLGRYKGVPFIFED